LAVTFGVVGKPAVPERLRLAVAALAVKPGDQLLEIGCGRGVAVALVCNLLTTGRIVAIDRSPGMIEAAERRNAGHIESGKAVFRTAEFAAADLVDERFDKIFAVNVNLFWVRRAERELQLIRQLLRPGGSLYLFYETPGGRNLQDLADKLAVALSERGFSTERIVTPSQRLLGLVARNADPGG
jgi:SAM-dependent methyltransferase